MKPGIIIDSTLSLEEALRQNQELSAPQEILDQQAMLTVRYYSFDGNLHKGQIVINIEVSSDVKDLFEFIEEIKFPIGKVTPASVEDNDDEKLGLKNISSGFNYRYIANTTRHSNHSFGRAIDLNPFQNPYDKPGYYAPKGAVYDPEAKGTITTKNPLVTFMKKRGWEWHGLGGDWTDGIDYMHFDKPSIKSD